MSNAKVRHRRRRRAERRKARFFEKARWQLMKKKAVSDMSLWLPA